MKLRGRIEFHKYTIQVSTGTLIPQCGQKVKKKQHIKKIPILAKYAIIYIIIQHLDFFILKRCNK